MRLVVQPVQASRNPESKPEDLHLIMSMPGTAAQVVSQHELLARLAEARARSDELFGIVRRDALYHRPIPERHRIVFYIGHLEAFDWNLLGTRALKLPAFDAALDKLFAFGIDPVDGGLPQDQPADWPALDAVHGYVRRARQTLDEHLATTPLDGAAPELLRDGLALHVAIEHRLMHVETLAYMFHRLPLEAKIAQLQAEVAVTAAPVHSMIEIPAGRATLGLPRGDGRFGWDNEFQAHAVEVPAFRIGKYSVTNAQFLEFMRDGCYQHQEFWTPANWQWLERSGIRHPQFWSQRGDQWLYRGMFQEIALPQDWPVYVSHAEASAYAKWAGQSLPTEAQFHRAAFGATAGSPGGEERAFPWGYELPGPQHGNFDFARWDPAPVNAYPQGKSAFGVADLLGNGWQWTATLFQPFAGFERFSFYPGYSADFFDGQHFVMKGGSPRTAVTLLRRSFRNWFQPRYPYVYATFRCVENLEGTR